ncbi:MAG TPA: CHAD domain-containing protein [Solirubrobacteraceae bacterium]|nr:CHAD domain-containing protein [Solirubrobacteraceae bacterium]
MPYRLEPGEPVRDGVRRCSREQLDRAVEELTDGIRADPVEAIHEARKALKKQRSLLRLARAAFPAAERRQEASVFREAARKLSGSRDADVMITALDDLAERFRGTVSQPTLAAARERLVARRDEERDRATRSGTTAAVAIDLRAARRRVDDWKLRRGGWAALAPGLERTYRRGRDAFTLAEAEPTPEHLHDWRKRVKDVWYQLRLLRPLSESTMCGQADEAHRLSELLGDDHDLWVLREALSTMDGEAGADLGPLVRVIDHHRAEFETDAFLLGERLYAEKPKAFMRRLHRYWNAWRAESRARVSAGPG